MVCTFKNRHGLELAASIMGHPDDQIILFLHGGGQTRHSWDNSMQAFAKRGFLTISYDARGHGNSAWAPDKSYNLEELSNDLIDVLKALSKPPIIVGASMGGLTAINTIGITDQNLIRALVLVDVVPEINPEGANNILSFLNKHTDGFNSLEQASEVVSNYNPNRPRPKDPSGLLKNLRESANGRLYWHWDPEFFKTSDLIKYQDLQLQLQNACKKINFPVMLVRGMKSDVVTDEGIDSLRKCIPHLQVYEVAKAGHMITGDRNDNFNAGIETFINSLNSLPSTTR